LSSVAPLWVNEASVAEDPDFHCCLRDDTVAATARQKGQLALVPTRGVALINRVRKTVVSRKIRAAVVGLTAALMATTAMAYDDAQLQQLLKTKICVGCNLGDANLSKANLWNANLSKANLVNADLSNADLKYANLRGTKLNNANLHGADLYSANLAGGTDLSGANLEYANLQGTKLSNANLHGANLHGANLNIADLWAADLRGADLSGANFSRADLSRVIWTDGRTCADGSIGECK